MNVVPGGVGKRFFGDHFQAIFGKSKVIYSRKRFLCHQFILNHYRSYWIPLRTHHKSVKAFAFNVLPRYVFSVQANIFNVSWVYSFFLLFLSLQLFISQNTGIRTCRSCRTAGRCLVLTCRTRTFLKSCCSAVCSVSAALAPIVFKSGLSETNIVYSHY